MSGFQDFDSLMVSIADWLGRDDLTARIKDFLWLAECDIQRTIKFRDPQDKIYAGATKAEQWIDLPSDYAEGGLLRWTSDTTLPTLTVASIDVVDRLQRQADQALESTALRAGFVWGNRLYIGPTPGDGTEFELFYHAGVQHLGPKNPSNNILRESPDALLYGALATSAPYLVADERLGMWVELYTNAKEEARMAEWRARTGHGALHMRPDIRVY